MGSTRTRCCDFWADHRLEPLIASCRRGRIERKDGNTQYFIFCGLPVLVLREISKVDCGSIPERSPLPTTAERADFFCIPSGERTQ